MPSVPASGSSRSAGRSRSRRAPTAPAGPGRPHVAPPVTPGCLPRYAACTSQATASTASSRSGTICATRASAWRAALSSGSCAQTASRASLPARAPKRRCRGQGRWPRPISWGATSLPRAPMSSGSPTSPTSAPGRDGATSPSHSTSTPGASSVGSLPATCAKAWSATRSTWRWPPARSTTAAWWRTPTTVRSYTSYEYTERLKRAGIAPSRGCTGTALDNAMAESVISTIKRELVSRYTWRTRLDLELALMTYIGWYNSRRRHRSPKRMSGGQTRRLAPTQVLAQYNREVAGSLVPK